MQFQLPYDFPVKPNKVRKLHSDSWKPHCSLIQYGVSTIIDNLTDFSIAGYHLFMCKYAPHDNPSADEYNAEKRRVQFRQQRIKEQSYWKTNELFLLFYIDVTPI